MSRRVAVIGLDCAEPSLVFGPWLDDLPNLRGLVDRGTWGPLRSIHPPITVPAWSCMTSSRDPALPGGFALDLPPTPASPGDGRGRRARLWLAGASDQLKTERRGPLPKECR